MTVPESWGTRAFRWLFNVFPAYRGTGARVVHIAHDWSEVRVRLTLHWRTRNYVGTIFGGSMYGAIDPVYMMMLMRQLGPDYIVWDKAATIRFRKPGREPLFATFLITPSDLSEIRDAVSANGKTEKEFAIDLVSASGEVHASFTKLLSIRHRSHPTRSH
jgi:hypothetical protein